jgi:hypothetical protein
MTILYTDISKENTKFSQRNERKQMMFTATFASTKDSSEYEVQVEGESVETVGEYLDNCGKYDGDLLLSVEPNDQ